MSSIEKRYRVFKNYVLENKGDMSIVSLLDSFLSTVNAKYDGNKSELEMIIDYLDGEYEVMYVINLLANTIDSKLDVLDLNNYFVEVKLDESTEDKHKFKVTIVINSREVYYDLGYYDLDYIINNVNDLSIRVVHYVLLVIISTNGGK